jgi:hypothetical protein
VSLLDGKRARSLARWGGVLYLIIIVIGALGEAVVRGRIVDSGDARATAANLQSLEWLWRLGVAGEVLLLVGATGLTVILFVLLRPVNRDLAVAAVLFNLVSISTEGGAAVSLAGALSPLTNPVYLRAFGPEQVHAMAMLSIRAHTTGFGIALIFFGVECILLGRLIYRSGFLPRTLGVLMPIAGVCYLVNSFSVLLSPPLASRLFPAVLLPCLIAELALALWLLVKGVDVDAWDRARRPPPAA